MTDESAIHRLRQGVAVITGATGTLGQELAAEFARLGFSLVLIGRDQLSLEELAKTLRHDGAASVQPVLCDLSQSASLAQLAEWVREACEERSITVLVHCAASDSRSREAAAVERDFNVNLHTAERLVNLAFDDMARDGAGEIILVSSNLALTAGKNGSAYAATKARLETLADSLRARLPSPGIHILTVVPGLIDSPLLQTGLARLPQWQQRFFRPRGSASELARRIVHEGIGRSGLLILDPRHRIVRLIARRLPWRRGAR